jgi:hypothetical protein
MPTKPAPRRQAPEDHGATVARWRVAYYTRLLAEDHDAPRSQREARERLLAEAEADLARALSHASDQGKAC